MININNIQYRTIEKNCKLTTFFRLWGSRGEAPPPSHHHPEQLLGLQSKRQDQAGQDAVWRLHAAGEELQVQRGKASLDPFGPCRVPPAQAACSETRIRALSCQIYSHSFR